MQEYFVNRFPSNSNSFEGLVYLGNDLNDLPLMRHAGFAIAPADAHRRVREIAHLVLPERGGDGFVRAFIELLLGIDFFLIHRKLLISIDTELISDNSHSQIIRIFQPMDLSSS